MAHTEHYYTKFEEGRFYHVYNRAVGTQLLFKNEDNFLFFLKKCSNYLPEVIDTYAYCLLPNHFHLLIRVKEKHELSEATSEKMLTDDSIHNLVSHQFQKLFQSYAMAFNKQQKRNGTLFQTPFKRALITNDAYFGQIIYYIHSNPQNHDLISDFRNWKWSSYNAIAADKPTKLNKEDVLNWFGGKAAYHDYHTSLHEFTIEKKLLFD